MMTRSVTAEPRLVPNQPLTLAGETASRAEDGIIAYSRDKYLRTGDETWPNTDHSPKGSDAQEKVLAFHHAMVAGQPARSFRGASRSME
jgi:hypothetical protein